VSQDSPSRGEKQDPDVNNALHVLGVNVDCLRLNWESYGSKASSKYTGDLYALSIACAM